MVDNFGVLIFIESQRKPSEFHNNQLTKFSCTNNDVINARSRFSSVSFVTKPPAKKFGQVYSTG